MSDLLPCRFCQAVPVPEPEIRSATASSFYNAIGHDCLGSYHTTAEAAAAEWNAANAPADPALLALSRLGARLCRDQLSPTGGFSHAPYAVLDRMGVEEGVLMVGYPDSTGPVMKDGIRKAISDILGTVGGYIMGGNEEL